MSKARVLLVGIYDTNTVALAPQVLRSFVETLPVGEHFEIQTLDLSIFSQSVSDMERLIAERRAQIVGFSTYVWNYPFVRALAPRIDGTVVLGGPHCNDVDDDFFRKNPGVDYVVTGEGEETFADLLAHFAGGSALDRIPGLRAPGLRNAARDTLADIDRAPSPYPRIFREHPDLEWIAYETSRGCPFLCGFCTWGYSKKMRYHALERVLGDLDLLLAQPSLRRIYLCDSSILLEKERAKAIVRHIVDRNPSVALRYEFDAEHLDEELVELLMQLPENDLNFGLQTANPRARSVMRRPFHQARFEESFQRIARRAGPASLTMDVIYGLPGDDLAGYLDTLEYAMSFPQVGWILTNPLVLLPGSDFHRDRTQHGIAVRDDESNVVTATSTFAADEVSKAIEVSFYVAVTFANQRFREAMRRWARARGERTVDVIVEFFRALPFSLVEDGRYPYLIPSAARDFRARNLAVHRVASLYPEILECLHQRTAGAYRELLADHDAHWTEPWLRLRRFAAEELERSGTARFSAAAPG